MNEFHEKSKVETQSLTILKPFFESRGWTFGEHHPAFSKSGDYPVTRGDQRLNFEFKAEMHTRPTLFVEFMSNIETGRHGWYYTLEADKLIYHFLDGHRVHVIDMKKLRTDMTCWNFRTVKQDKTVQNNITFGWSVPIDALEAVGVCQTLELNPLDTSRQEKHEQSGSSSGCESQSGNGNHSNQSILA